MAFDAARRSVSCSTVPPLRRPPGLFSAGQLSRGAALVGEVLLRLRTQLRGDRAHRRFRILHSARPPPSAPASALPRRGRSRYRSCPILFLGESAAPDVSSLMTAPRTASIPWARIKSATLSLMKLRACQATRACSGEAARACIPLVRGSEVAVRSIPTSGTRTSYICACRQGDQYCRGRQVSCPINTLLERYW